jgi:hypothetical protein
MPKGIPQNLPMSSLKIIHPQKWPENLNVVDKTIIVIGSGATAVTIVPELAAEAKWLLCCNDHQPILPLCRIKIKLPLK